MKVVYITNKGLTREQNEDSLLVNKSVFNCVDMKEVVEEKIDSSYKHFFIADGLGGEEKGEVASGMVLDYLSDKVFETKEKLAMEIKEAKLELEEFSRKNNNIMLGTTLSGVIINEEDIFVLNIGDTRIYKLEENFITQLSVDHTLAQEEVKRGRLSASRLRHHPMRNFLTSSISGSAGFGKIRMHSEKTKLTKNEILIILSDGVWEQFENYEIFKFFHTNANLKDAVEKLYKKSYSNSKDNLSIIAIQK